MHLFILPTALLVLLPMASPSIVHRSLPKAAGVIEQQPMITPSPAQWSPTKTLKRRGVISDAVGEITDAAGAIGSELAQLGSNIPSYVASGIPNFFQEFPTGDKVQSNLGLDDDQIRALPTQVLNIPPYGNWTDRGWNVRFHGNVYKQPNISESKLNDLANIFLIDTSVEELPPPQASQARNLTAEIFILQQSNQNVTFNLAPAPTAGASGEQGGGGAVTPSGGNQRIRFPIPTTPEGDYDSFVNINENGLATGNSTNEVQRLNVYTEGDINGNATAYLVPPTGLTIISDIDDILRVTKIYDPKEGLLNSFARPFVQWDHMPDVYANWSRSIPNLHFHYLTTTPEQITRNYMDFIYKTYPGGSFDTRPLNFSDVSATLSIRQFLLDKIFQTFPGRKFVLVADTSNSDVMRDYPKLVGAYPGQVQCILLRNTSATDPSDHFPYDTKGFQGVDDNLFMFFKVSDDLANLDLAAGQCRNGTIPQNVTYGLQGLPFGKNLGSGKKSAGSYLAPSGSWALAAALAVMMWGVGLGL